MPTTCGASKSGWRETPAIATNCISSSAPGRSWIACRGRRSTRASPARRSRWWPCRPRRKPRRLPGGGRSCAAARRLIGMGSMLAALAVGFGDRHASAARSERAFAARSAGGGKPGPVLPGRRHRILADARSRRPVSRRWGRACTLTRSPMLTASDRRPPAARDRQPCCWWPCWPWPPAAIPRPRSWRRGADRPDGHQQPARVVAQV